ncbi:cytochrome P450 [Conidiobolus coronatus NRRL 28638]|uniref:Cytochrome P450 n=1 Tax=Conidiobolus coronatus (strain ATCC 28846 / CBS 209.66 / NRRL 28638) TaxID=796925 RepID=A0A137NS04_CONC2|nr:cytochrome P450 [Conidiobolus coronatus NRRL 28638]|eukprot:KXN65535.1 cytochrome P450 [Conidiobolus coronatus NRRL 28638]
MIQYLSATLIAYLSYKIYNLTRCPNEIKHLPSLPLWSFFCFSFSNESFPEKLKKEFQPMFDKYGIVRVFTHFGWSVFIADSKLCIFIKTDFTKIPVSENFMKFFGPSQVLSNNGEEWKRHRKVINPIFNQSWNTELFGECVRDVISEWEEQTDKEIKIHDNIQRMTLDVFGKAIFDVNFEAVIDKSSRIYHLYNDITDKISGQTLYLIAPFMEYIPYFRRPKLRQQINKYHEFVEEMMEMKKKQYRKGTEKPKDLITAFIESNEKEDQYKLTNDEIRDNITIFILAGHDTTSNTLSSTLYYLARYPEIQDKLRKEVLEALGHPAELTTPTIDQLKNIPYMDLVNKESMRIMATAVDVQRDAAQPYTLSNGVTIPKGTHIFLHLWGLHMNPSAFSKPEEFNPDRFSDLHSEESRNWLAFSTGPRSCIGMTFSLMEQRVTIAMLLQKFEFSITKNNPDYEKLRITPSGIVRPRDLHLVVKLRK